MDEVVHYHQLVAFLKEASLHEIYRVSVALRHALEDPVRVAATRNQFKEGDAVEYFDKKANKLIPALVIKKKLKYVLVANCHDGQRWDIPYYMLNINSRDIVFEKPHRGLDKNTLQMGDWVGFNHDGEEITACLKRLNRKTVTLVTTKQQQWRVSYRNLYTVIEGEQHRAVIEHLPDVSAG